MSELLVTLWVVYDTFGFAIGLSLVLRWGMSALGVAQGMPIEGTERRIFRRRIGAFLVDWGLVLAALLISRSAFAAGRRDPRLLAAVVPLVWVGYFSIMEATWGSTWGKEFQGIMVVKQDGSPCTWRGAIIRNLFRAVDSLVVVYHVGFLVMLLSERRQRIGDRAARTVVVEKYRRLP